MKLFNSIFSIFLITGLSACGGGGDDSGENGDVSASLGYQSDTLIHSFYVRGSGTIGDVVLINPAINDGAFQFGWNLTAERIYHTELYLSDDIVAERSKARKLFSRNCNIALSDCQAFEMEYPCKFTMENKIECGLPGNIITTSVAGFVDILPKDAYLVFKACNGLFNKCDTKSVKIQLQ